MSTTTSPCSSCAHLSLDRQTDKLAPQEDRLFDHDRVNRRPAGARRRLKCVGARTASLETRYHVAAWITGQANVE